MLTASEKQYLDSLYEENLALLRALGRIPAPSGAEDRRAAFLKEWLSREAGVNVRVDEAKNVIAEYRCTENCPVVLFAAHTDVAFPLTEELPMREEQGRLYAPGIGDDTGNLVNLLLAFRWLRRFCPDRVGIVVAANACEEGLGNLKGTRALFAHYGERVKRFVSFDVYTGELCASAVGSHRYRITVRGKGGHSYADFGTPSAIAQAAELVCDLYAQELPQEVRTTMNVGTIRGGTTVNAIAQEAELQYEYRSESDEALQQLQENLERILQRHREKGAEVQCEVIGIRPGNAPGEIPGLAELTARNAALIREYAGGVSIEALSTDANIPLSLGIPANTVGTVVGGSLHTMEEWLDLAAQRQGMYLAAEILRDMTE